MKPSTLSSIKTEIRKFNVVYDMLVEMWNGKLEHGNNATYPETIQVSIILQNMGFDGSNCQNYSHEEAVQKLKDQLQVLKAINEYHSKCYMTHYAYNEVDCIYEGECMSEEYSDYYSSLEDELEYPNTLTEFSYEDSNSYKEELAHLRDMVDPCLSEGDYWDGDEFQLG